VEVVIQRFGVYLVSLDPAFGSEIRKTRPCAVISPDEMNRHLKTVIVAPMTTAKKGYPTRVACVFAKTNGEIALDQMRAIDQSRLIKRLGQLDQRFADETIRTLMKLFA
jgi:mRNA interferase MazF